MGQQIERRWRASSNSLARSRERVGVRAGLAREAHAVGTRRLLSLTLSSALAAEREKI
jgi:hypothetical protein